MKAFCVTTLQMTSPTIHKLSNIQSLRGLAALLVVFTHLPSMEIKHGGDMILPAFFRFGISGVDMFFVISGFIMVYVTWSSERSPKRSLKFLFARLTRIYPIYWLIAGAVFVAWLFKPAVMTYDPAQTNIVKSFLLWPDQTLPMLKVAWTLVHELYFYLVFAVILLLPRRFLLPAFGLWAAAVIGGNLSGFGKLSPETALITHPLTFEFFMGAVAGWLFMRAASKDDSPKDNGKSSGVLWVIIGGLAFIGAIIYLALTLDGAAFPSNWARVGYFGLPAAFIVYGLSAMDLSGITLPKWSSTFGDWSYSLYLSHILTLSILGYMWRPFTREGPLDNIIALSILLIGCIIASAISWYMFERPMLRFFKRIRGKIFP